MGKHKSKKRMKYDLGLIASTLFKANLMGYAVTAIFIILSAIVLTYTNFGDGFEKIILIVGVIASSAIVGYDTAKIEKKNAYKWGALGGFSYIVIYAIVAIIFNGISSISLGAISILAICALGSSIASGMFLAVAQK
ncbi:MAG: TIGR04086 family membrane protein [Cellulosilyticaceae bacterium]